MLPQASFDTLSVFTINGHELNIDFSKNDNSVDLDVQNLPSGMYFVNIISEGKTITKRFVKE